MTHKDPGDNGAEDRMDADDHQADPEGVPKRQEDFRLVQGGNDLSDALFERTETATLFIYRALDERQYIGAYSAALVLGLFSLILVLGSDWLRNRKH